jgi:hypothetical protein|tara:strand:- start:817 stop:1035 length:219 start_codon:yes stop_codon:yes gene_type:complete
MISGFKSYNKKLDQLSRSRLMASSLSKASNLTKVIGAYRVIDLNYVLKCHPLEPLDRIHLVEEFTYPIVILG